MPTSTQFLPEPEPLAPAPAPYKKQARKTLALWALLIVMFLAIWQFLQPSPGQPHSSRPAPLPACETSFWSTGFPPLVLAIVFIGLLVWLFARTYRLSNTFSLTAERGRIAVAEGRPLEAVDVFVKLAAAHAKQPGYEAAALTSAAHAELWAGRLDEAIAKLARIERGRLLPFASQSRTLAAALLAFAYALAGELDASERWAAEARSRVAKNRDDRILYAAHLRVAEAVLAIRRGRPQDGVALLDERWAVLREAFSASSMRVAELVRALAESAGGVRDYNGVVDRLVRVQPTAPGELGFLGLKWPEMRSFLAAHGL